ncbi:MAG: type II secretion system protein [Patescibacteria group bacterium]
MILPLIKIKNQKGQTLLEALAASAVILIGIISAVSLLIYSINVAQVNSLKIQAHYLAMESLEIARSVRDSKRLYITGFNEEFVNIRYVTDNQYLLPFMGTASSPSITNTNFPLDKICSDHECYNLIDTPSGEMRYDTGSLTLNKETTVFKRYLALYRICEGDLIMESPAYDGQECSDLGLEQIGTKASAHVLFTLGTKDYDYVLEEDLYNWQYASEI